LGERFQRPISPVESPNWDDVRLLVVAEDPLVRAGLRTLVEDYEWLNVVGQVAPGTNLNEDLEAYAPDIVLWDLGWEADSGIEKLTEVDWVDLPLVVLLADAELASAAWHAGARGLLSREVGSDSLAAALGTVLHGLAAVEPEMLSALLPPALGAPSLVEPLTAREMDVLRLMAEGLPNKAIAAQLEISEFTVKFHVNAILGKLGAQSRTEAAMIAVRMGLIPL
jgi:two-component system nitrate/nitrite response regulator NarL